MSYKYLLDLHQLIDTRIGEAKESIDHEDNDSEGVAFHKGRIDILSDFKHFLTKNLNPKLPRSLRKNLSHPLAK